MKIRIEGNCIRFGLTKSDLTRLADLGTVWESIDFCENHLLYEVRATSDDTLSLNLVDYIICLAIPVEMIRRWRHSDMLGFETKAGSVHVLIEKDFTFLDHKMEDQKDDYTNPSTDVPK